MKLDVSFSSLWNCVREMGAKESSFNLDLELEAADFDFDAQLSNREGVEISLDSLASESGLLSVNGRQILLFIPDQGPKISDVLRGEAEGNRFHIADCKTLGSMRKKSRFERYKVTNNLSGYFHVFGQDYYSKEAVEGEAQLVVCRNCLSMLNYKGYKSKKTLRDSIVAGFEIGEFFSNYSSLFKALPKENTFLTGGGYTSDWKEVSDAYKSRVSFCCERCQVDLSSHKQLLHSHHINGNKQDNRAENLKALCMDCHRKEPLHDHMRVSHNKMQLITSLRCKQSLLDTQTWDSAFTMSDPSVHGLLHFYQDKGLRKPEVGYAISDNGNEIVAQLEIAWPTTNKGIAISKKDHDVAVSLGWSITMIGDAIRSMC